MCDIRITNITNIGTLFFLSTECRLVIGDLDQCGVGLLPNKITRDISFEHIFC